MPASEPQVQEETGLDAFTAEPLVEEETPTTGNEFVQPEPEVVEETDATDFAAFGQPEP